MTKLFSKILIANRGEIACRVIRTAHRMGIRTVAVYSDADAKALHVEMADEALHIGPSPVGESYLRGDLIIDAALRTGAEAIHPGYGFLSENPDFVDQVTAAGLTFIGPSADAIRAMGLKDAAKRLMEKAGVPVVPGYHGEAQEIVVLATKAHEIGYPVLIKARAGGGGKGMRRVDDPDSFPEALAGAKREAKAAFGDDRVLVEKYILSPRHIEVQVFGDNHGNAVHLFERDCSAQRRHQKVIEEAPAPGMTAEMRQAMTEAAVKAARAINYSGAGTIEFIVDASAGLRPEGFWFMEMNTRLQVEHPVTEMVTGIDLVEWQLRVAAGEPLPRDQEQITLSGHAFEARLYAEDPAKGFLPATGTLHHLDFPQENASLRVETGVRQGDAISPFYDPMIAKLVTHGATREDALESLVAAVDATRVAGSVTNKNFLAQLGRDAEFAAGKVDTGMIERKGEALVSRRQPSERATAIAALAAAGASDVADRADPWAALRGYAHFHPVARSVTIGEDEAVQARIAPSGSGWTVTPEGSTAAITLPADAAAEAVRWPGHLTVFENGVGFDFAHADPLDQAAGAGAASGGLRAPMPGLVKLVRVAPGDTVQKGQPLLVLEAMKMEHTITAPQDAVVATIVSQGDQVEDKVVLVTFEEATG
ncbi:acetyl-CoA carboxylase biotin carboxylase subunit [Tianweitania sediminis]|uniref:Acetyl/propionyl/methylcrotonyl-CoA carboxylase subunit alpha n=1 Tax=Tianweitania sediminis TaxID=1502156 RepID=A0A8J7UH86_9HYPH|nr:acetyl/propionyl/methylcrotonyl-CoA carboxylase subunit alpha [Tianweitania sediminis]MBP0438934.1 acetyl/propionyl/methylcrotonyl-CoA carboxylase subunit alpha [Tianweitania sediminis]